MRFNVLQLIDQITTSQPDSTSPLQSIAQTFLQAQEKPLSSNWRTTTCFDDLSEWFLKSSRIENHMKWAMHCWYEKLNHAIPSDINPRDLISLGSAFLDESHKFAAFIYWLCEQQVSLQHIEKSYLLHQYFAYHCSDLSELHNTYALLIDVSPSTELFLLHAGMIAVGLRGFINQEKSDIFYSYNVLGTSFPHAQACQEISMNDIQQKQLLASDQFNQVGVEFYRLFGWSFISALDFENRLNETLFIKIVRSPDIKHQLLREFEKRALNNEMSDHTTKILLDCLKKTMDWAVDVLDQDTIEKIPFLIHAFNPSFYEPSLIQTIRQKFLTDEKYHTLSHVPLLVTFYRHTQTIPETEVNEKILALALIFKIILPYGNNLSDELLNSLESIKDVLKPFVQYQWDDYAHNLSSAISAHSAGQTSYSVVEHLWGAQLSAVHLFCVLYPEMRSDEAMHKKYALREKVLFQRYSQQAQESLVDITSFVDEMCIDKEDIKKTLQETLIRNHHLDFIRSILLYIVKRDALIEYCFKPFGDYPSLFQAAIQKNHETLLNEICHVIELSSKKIWQSLFFNSVSQGDITLLRVLCGYKNKIPLFYDIAFEAVNKAVNRNQWDIVQLLCGLQNDPMHNPPIKLGVSVNLYLDIVSNDFMIPKSRLCFTNSTGDTLLHLAARARHYPTVRQLIDLLYNHLTAPELRDYFCATNKNDQLAYCPGRCPVASQINTYLAQFREQLTQLSETVESRKRKREEVPETELFRRTNHIARLWALPLATPSDDSELASTVILDEDSDSTHDTASEEYNLM